LVGRARFLHVAKRENQSSQQPTFFMSYQVFVDDNFHYTEEEHRYFLG
jgi:hypothetical protein